MRYKSEQAQVGSLIRKEIKAKYPKLKIRISSQSFSGGNSLDLVFLRDQENKKVSQEKIKEITDKYEAGRFDGMNDIYEYTNSRDDIPQVKYLFVSEEIQSGLFERLFNAFLEKDSFYGECSISKYPSYNFKDVMIGELRTNTSENNGKFYRFISEYLK